MAHKEYRHIVSGAKRAVLFVHGIAGTPDHFADLIPLVPKDVTVVNLLLDGHGRDVRAFSRTSMRKWEAQVEQAVEELAASHEELSIVAHSMGTLFAIEQAVKREKITALFLLAVPMKLRLKLSMVRSTLKVYFGRIGTDMWAQAAKESCSITLCKNPLRYLGWIPRFLELFGKIRRPRKLLPHLKTPAVAFQSQKDEMVALSSLAYLQKNASVDARVLAKSGHYYYEETDRATLTEAFFVWIKEKGSR